MYRLLDGIEDFGGSVMISPGQSTVAFPRDNFAISAEDFDPENFEGVTFSTDTRDNFDSGRIGTSAGTSIPDTSVAAITLPPSLLATSSNVSRRVSFTVFADDTLFQPRGGTDDVQVGSVFISATLHGSIVRGLQDPVSIQFEKTTVILSQNILILKLCIYCRNFVEKCAVCLCVLGYKPRRYVQTITSCPAKRITANTS